MNENLLMVKIDIIDKVDENRSKTQKLAQSSTNKTKSLCHSIEIQFLRLFAVLFIKNREHFSLERKGGATR